MSVKLTNGIYIWNGTFGCVIKSFENQVKEGDVRFIAGSFYYAYSVNKRLFSKDMVWWCLCKKMFTVEDIMEAKLLFEQSFLAGNEELEQVGK